METLYDSLVAEQAQRRRDWRANYQTPHGYVAYCGPVQWLRCSQDDWLEVLADEEAKEKFVDSIRKKLKPDMKLQWKKPRWVRDRDGQVWMYWKAVRA